MKSFKEIVRKKLEECACDSSDSDDYMTEKELKIAISSAQRILEMLDDGVEPERWQISAIVKASSELASVYNSMMVDAYTEEEPDFYDDYEDEEDYTGFPSMFEAVDKDHPIVKEYHALKKNDIKTLRNIIAGQRRITDVSEFRSKDHAVTTILRDRHGHKKVAAAFGLKEDTDLSEISHSDIDIEELKSAIDAAKKKDKIASVSAVKYIRNKHNISHAKAHSIWNNLRDELKESPLLGPQGKIHRAASMDQSDREYLRQRMFKDEWKKNNPDKSWPGYEKAGFKDPSYKTESNLSEISMELLQKVRDRGADRAVLSFGSTYKDPETGLKRLKMATDDEMELAKKGMKAFVMANKAIRKKAEKERIKKEETEIEESSFVAKAAHSKVDGKKSFKLKGDDKVYPVTIKHHHAHKIKKSIEEN